MSKKKVLIYITYIKTEVKFTIYSVKKNNNKFTIKKKVRNIVN